MHYHTAKSWGVLKQRVGAAVPPHTGIGVGPPCRQNKKAARPAIEPVLQEPESTPIQPSQTVLGRQGSLERKKAIGLHPSMGSGRNGRIGYEPGTLMSSISREAYILGCGIVLPAQWNDHVAEAVVPGQNRLRHRTMLAQTRDRRRNLLSSQSRSLLQGGYQGGYDGAQIQVQFELNSYSLSQASEFESLFTTAMASAAGVEVRESRV